MRPGGVLQDPVPQPAHQVRQAAAEAALPEDGVRLCDRAALLREDGGQGDHRDHDQGHADDGKLPVAEQQHGRIHVVQDQDFIQLSMLVRTQSRGQVSLMISVNLRG